MKRLFILTSICLLFAFVNIQGKSSSTPYIYIDGNGVMRWSDTRQEASFFGVNYTLPFAHAYRALGYLGLDRKAAIDKDVYHITRLGLNAYRIHLWDVELTDEQGNLLENEHLDLMDYLIAKLKERNIHIVITAQTNFGNGYPERNIQTGGFSYKYDKCDVHSHPEAITAQETYLHNLVKHINPYTGIAYKDDPSIVGFEINNEPCHSGTKEEVKAYINRMLEAIHRTGNRKPVFYNVSHNEYVVEAYYETAIQGTTYQWYPIGLVSGQTQQGNFLPYIDRYDISFADKVKGFHKKARLIYEFDPADIMYSYMYPAMARTFRMAGFQWVTQFAYDPMDIAYANTEYQTHFLNLAYTPHKAISIKIAAEAARHLRRGESYGSYPQDTLFGDGFRVSYTENLSELNNGRKYYYSNNTHSLPRNASQLMSIAGCGSSPVVHYEGTGAYFIDCLEAGVWRLEVMPDAVTVSDPFAKPSLAKEVVSIIYGCWDMALQIPDLGESFTLTALNKENQRKEETVKDGVIRNLQPGVYLLKRKNCTPKQNWTTDSRWNSFVSESLQPLPRIQQITSGIEAYTLPEWNDLKRTLIDFSPIEKPLLRFAFTSKGEKTHHFLRKSIQDVLKERKGKLKSCTTLCIRVNRHKNLPEGFYAGFITSDGYTYKTICSTPSPEGIIRIPLKKLHQADTALLPIAYPTFLKQYFHPETDIPFQMEKAEKLELSLLGKDKTESIIELGEIWLE